MNKLVHFLTDFKLPKIATFSLILLIWTNVVFAQNSIDFLKTDAEVENFIHKNFNIVFSFDELKKYDRQRVEKIMDSLHIKNWQITDFDKNGFNDLLVFQGTEGWGFFVIFAFPNHKYQKLELYKESACLSKFMVDFPKIDTIGNVSVVKLYQLKKCYKNRNWQIDTLIYQNNQFIEFFKLPQKVDKIKLIFENRFFVSKVVIKKDRKIRYLSYLKRGYDHILPRTRKSFSKLISQNSFDSLWQTVESIQWDRLNSNYSVCDCEDAGGYKIDVYFGNKRHKIEDYGEQGTYGLAYLYEWIEKYSDAVLIKSNKMKN